MRSTERAVIRTRIRRETDAEHGHAPRPPRRSDRDVPRASRAPTVDLVQPMAAQCDLLWPGPICALQFLQHGPRPGPRVIRPPAALMRADVSDMTGGALRRFLVDCCRRSIPALCVDRARGAGGAPTDDCARSVADAARPRQHRGVEVTDEHGDALVFGERALELREEGRRGDPRGRAPASPRGRDRPGRGADRAGHRDPPRQEGADREAVHARLRAGARWRCPTAPIT